MAWRRSGTRPFLVVMVTNYRLILSNKIGPMCKPSKHKLLESTPDGISVGWIQVRHQPEQLRPPASRIS